LYNPEKAVMVKARGHHEWLHGRGQGTSPTRVLLTAIDRSHCRARLWPGDANKVQNQLDAPDRSRMPRCGRASPERQPRGRAPRCCSCSWPQPSLHRCWRPRPVRQSHMVAPQTPYSRCRRLRGLLIRAPAPRWRRPAAAGMRCRHRRWCRHLTCQTQTPTDTSPFLRSLVETLACSCWLQ
jgi:hypothetical protein